MFHDSQSSEEGTPTRKRMRLEMEEMEEMRFQYVHDAMEEEMEKGTDFDLKKNWMLLSTLSEEFVERVSLVYIFGGSGSEKYKETTAMLVTKDKQVYSVGSNADGLLGIGEKDLTLFVSASEPKKVDALCGLEIKDFKSVSFCSSTERYIFNGIHCFALTKDGQMFAWGHNDNAGKLGLGIESGGTEPDKENLQRVLVPRKIQFPDEAKITSFACSTTHALAVSDNGDVYGWGVNEKRALGLPESTHSSAVPVKISNLLFKNIKNAKVARVACGAYFSCVLMRDGKLYGWGSNAAGQIHHTSNTGFGAWFPNPSPMFPELTIKKVVCGRSHVLVLTSEGDVHAWGCNLFGQLGLGRMTPHQLKRKLKVGTRLLRGCEDIASFSWGNFCAVKQGGKKFYFWGDHFDDMKIDKPKSTYCVSGSMHELVKYTFKFPVMHQPMKIQRKTGADWADVLEKAFLNSAGFPADIKFVTADEKEIIAHSQILALKNAYFAKHLSPEWSGGIKDVDGYKVVQAPETQYETLFALLYHIYTNKLSFQSDDVDEILELMRIADFYCDTELIEKGTQLLRNKFTVENVVSMYAKAAQINCQTLKRSAFNYIVANWKAINTGGFLRQSALPLENYIEILEEVARVNK